ncbi:MAG: FAD-dependent oxidoreductase [Pseudopedobacter saltans]|uniref:FAD-dependent oxidoreductase n=1 Tax=Pseudopedobacter saltans TaxID=151895 RepID=A0A2W5GYH1_9SPHI|nr:MAG: FAD-dependent oxidoreductase [Pseudopedobacter saltans]
MKREVLISQLESTPHWDVIIIGGGATGLGTAMDAATRGYKTILVEQADFAKGTSSKATKLVHGGVRYMAQGDLGLVKEACHERGLLLKNAPHLTRNTSFVIPNYSIWDNIKYTIGLKFYDFLAGKLSLGKSRYISKKEVLRDLPTVSPKGLRGGVVYQDGQFDDSRLAVNIAETAVDNGACVLNYFKVIGVIKDNNGKVNGIKAKDIETNKEYEITGKVVINATGVYADNILQMDRPNAPHFVRPSQGVHLTLDRSFLPGDNALMIPKTSDGRVLFAVPWHNKLIVGTTDTLREHPELEPRALEEEIEFILKTAQQYLTKQPTRKDVLAVFAGLRPLAAPQGDGKNTKEISRSHKIMVSDSGLVTIIGGKWTTFRRMAQDTIDKAIEVGEIPAKECVTEQLHIHGYDTTVNHAEELHFYGSDLKKIKELETQEPALKERLLPNYEYTVGNVVFAVRNELAVKVEDVLARRFRLLFLDAKAAVEASGKVAQIMAKELGKDQAWIDSEVSQFAQLAKVYELN